jgi:hypothetical protein
MKKLLNKLLMKLSWLSPLKLLLTLKKELTVTPLLSPKLIKKLPIPSLSELKEKLTSPLLKKILLTNSPDGPEKLLSSKHSWKN